jgi:hypothetical protein
MTHTRLNKIGFLRMDLRKTIKKPNHCENCGIILSRHGRLNKSGFCYGCKNSLRASKKGRDILKQRSKL